MNKRAVIYARVSTDEQAEKGYSIPSQLEACRKYADDHDYEIIAEFKDDYSGREIDRPGLNALRQLLGVTKVDALIIYSGDRLSRDLAHSIELRRELSLLEVELCKVLGGQVDDSPHGRFTENVIGAVSQLEVEMIIERTQRGKNQRAKSGHMILQGYPPYGYDKVGNGHDAKCLIEEKQALVVRNIFNWYINGNGSNGPMSLRAIATYLNKIGAPPPDNSINSVTYWNPFTVRKILTNEIYAGRTYWGKSRMVNKKRIYQPRERWIPIDVPELVIIDRSTFEEAGKRAERNKQLAKRNRKNTYLMSGFFRCGGCGATMIGHNRTYESGNSARYYRCGNSWKQFKGEKKCGFKTIDTVIHKVDDAVWSWLKGLLCDTEALEAGIQEMLENQSREIAPKQQRVNLLEHLIEEEQKRLRRLVSEMSKHDDQIVLSAFRAEIDQATNNSNALTEERDILTQELAHVVLTDDQLDQIMGYASRIRDNLEEAGFEEKRRIMDILDVKVVLHYDDKGKWLEVTCAIPTYNDAIELPPSAERLPAQGTAGRSSPGGGLSGHTWLPGTFYPGRAPTTSCEGTT